MGQSIAVMPGERGRELRVVVDKEAFKTPGRFVDGAIGVGGALIVKTAEAVAGTASNASASACRMSSCSSASSASVGGAGSGFDSRTFGVPMIVRVNAAGSPGLGSKRAGVSRIMAAVARRQVSGM